MKASRAREAHAIAPAKRIICSNITRMSDEALSLPPPRHQLSPHSRSTGIRHDVKVSISTPSLVTIASLPSIAAATTLQPEEPLVRRI